MTRALILSGGGEYSDPWHPFAQTSARITEILHAIGHEVEISEHVARRLADLRGVDVIVVNAAAGPMADASAARAGLLEALGRGLGVLAIHVGACTLLRLPEWESVTGAVWVPGQSMHPKAGLAHVVTHQDRHPIVGPISDFDLVDERYTYLRLAPDIVPLASHEYEGRVHPLIWARERGQARVVVDALGHDLASYESQEHRRLIARAARWLAARC